VGILFIVGYGNGGRARLVADGVVAGIGVACMHYMGEAAMSMPDSVRYNTVLVVLSVIIAVIASTAALWAGTQVRGIGATIVASLVMGVAVTGMPGSPGCGVSHSAAMGSEHNVIEHRFEGGENIWRRGRQVRTLTPWSLGSLRSMRR
jgi:NO-binding membrane sensor protein with MHYT domain